MTLFDETPSESVRHWMPTRLILINYWLYHTQVFHFRAGRLFLTGHNGSGKSTALTAAITLLLDGDSSPGRMDPFGGNRRSVRYYLLGDADAGFQHDSRRAYVALEFLTPSGEHCTIGLGLQASASTRDLGKWGFFVPGRVQHPGGFSLINPAGFTLGRKELEEKARGLGGSLVQGAEDYAQLVQQKVFNQARPEDFRDLLSLIVTMRGSKLGQEVKPSRLEQLLRQALPPLSRGVLEQLSEGIERMDRHVEKVELLERQTRSAAQILQAHLAWGQAAGHAARRRELDLQASHQEAQSRVEQSQTEQEQLLLELQNLLPELLGVNQELDALTIEMDTLERQLQDQGGALSSLEQELENSRRDLERNRSQRRHQQERLERQQQKILELKQQISALEAQQQGILQKLQALPWWSEHALGERGRQLGHAQESLRAFEKDNALLQQHQADLERQSQRTTEAQHLLAEATSHLEEVLIRTTILVLQHTRHFDLPETVLHEYSGQLERQVEAQEAFGHIQQWVDARVAEAEQVMLERHTHTRELQQEHSALLARQQHLLEHPEAHPTLPAHRERVQQVLEESGIWARAFYQCLEPLDGATARELEGALSSAGILTALCTPDPARALEVLQAHRLTDVFLVNTGPTPHNLAACFEVINDRENCVLNVLRSIGLDSSTLTFVSSEGVWQNQLLTGNSLPQDMNFVGVTAREQARAQQIERLTSALSDTSERLEQSRLLLEEAQQNLTTLQEARSHLRDAPQEMPERNQARRERERARDLLDSRTADHEEALERLQQSLLQAQAATARLREAFAPLGLQEQEMNRAGLDWVVKEHQEAAGHHQRWQNNQVRLSSVQADLLERQQDLRAFQADLQQLEEEQQQLEHRRNTLSQQVQRLREETSPDVTQWRSRLNRARQRRNELLKNQQQLTRREAQHQARLAVLQQQHPALEKALEVKHQELEQARQHLEHWRQMFWSESQAISDLPDLPLHLLETQRDQAATRARDVFEEHKHHLETPENFLPTYTPQGPSFTFEGQKISAAELLDLLSSTLEQAQRLLSEEEAQVFRDELFTVLLEELHMRIREARNWVQGVKGTLKGLRFNSERLDLHFHLTEQTGLAVKMDDPTHPMHQPDSWKNDLRQEIRQKIEQIRSEGSQQESFQQALERFLDYRNWYGFQFYSFAGDGQGTERRREITDRTFQQRSGGERSAVLYTFLFAALAARFQALGGEVPRLIGIDEAFAGMDTANIAALYQIMVDLQFSWIATSERRVDLSPALPAASTYQLFRASSSKGDGVDSVCYVWNGRQSQPYRPVD